MDAIGKRIQEIRRKFNLKEIKKETPEENRKRTEEMERRFVAEYNAKKAKVFLKQRSLLNQKDALDAEYSDLDKNSSDKFKALTKRSLQVVRDFANKNMYTVILTGTQGSGKTMLTSCMLNKLNQATNLKCLFASTVKIYDLAMARYKNLSKEDLQDSQQALYHFMKSVKEADVLALDDLGSETALGAETREASQTMQEILFEIGEVIQDKGLIITTNNSLQDFSKMYNSKIISRLFTNNPEHIFNFKGIEDRRIGNR